MQEDLGTVPKALQERPQLDLRQRYYYSAFQALSRSRSVSATSPLPIPVTEIYAYVSMFQIDNLTERERLLKFVNRLDDEYLDYVASKMKK